MMQRKPARISALILAAAVALFILPVLVNAQPIGHFGKRFILKTNLINGIQLGFNNVDLEVVLGRRFSLELSYVGFDYNRGPNGVRRTTGSVNPRSGYGNYREFSYLKNGNTSGSYFGLATRFYFNSIIPAPYGFYMSFFAGYGSATYSNYDVSYTYKEKSNSSDVDEIVPREDVYGLNGESKIFVGEIPSFGFQRIFKRLIVVDAKISLVSQYGNLPEDLLNAYEHNNYVKSNTYSYGVGKFSFGVGTYLKIGLLIF